jgi:DNA polymerase-3 subunit alpha
MAFVLVEDSTGKIEVVLFTSAYNKYKHLIEEGNVLVFNGKVQERNGMMNMSAFEIFKPMEKQIPKNLELFITKDNINKTEKKPGIDNILPYLLTQSGLRFNFPTFKGTL